MITLKRIATALVAIGLMSVLVGAGISAQYTDNATAQANVQVGAFACTLTSTTPGAQITDNGHTVTFTDPEIQVSDPLQGGNDNGGLTVTLHNTGSMVEKTHWTVEGPMYNPSDYPYNVAPWNSYHSGPPGPGQTGTFGTANPPADLDPFAPGASQTYTGLGFMWLTPLTNSDLGFSTHATYHVTCGEHVVSASHVSYVGFNNALGHAALPYPAGTQAGDLAVAFTYGPGSSPYAGNPSGFTGINSTVANRTYLSYKILLAGDIAGGVPATTAGTGKSVAVYRGATGIGANTYAGTSSGLPPESANYPLYAPSLGAWNGQTLHKIDGSSWVGVMTYDSGNTTGNIRQMTFNKVLTLLGGAPNYTPPTFDGPVTVNRSAAAPAQNIGLADTNGGVADWDANDALHVQGGWVMPLSTTTHTTTTYSFEILSN